MKIIALGFLCFLLIGSGLALDIWFAPARDVQSAPVFAELDVDGFNNEFLADPSTAQMKYLAKDGESKIVAIEGKIESLDQDLNGGKVVVLSGEQSEALIRCTLLETESEKWNQLNLGEKIVIKGVVSAGAQYDEDLEMYEDALLHSCYF